MPDAAFWWPVATVLIVLPVSAVLAGCRLSHPPAALALHAGLFLLASAGWTAILGRPVFGTLLALSHWMTLFVTDRSKQDTVRERFVVQDFEFFPDTVMHPRLYLPFLGWGNFLMSASVTVTAITVGFLFESVPEERAGQWLALGVIAGLGGLLLAWGHLRRLPITLDPAIDIARLGMTASLWRYAQEIRQPMPPVDKLDAVVLKPPVPADRVLPHLVVVQSESFFDARVLFPGIRREVLANFDAMQAVSLAHGPVRVPVWGANTVRSEFAFLAGEDVKALGVHRYQPYWAVQRGLQVATLPGCLRRLGYRTIAVHPYTGSFYKRDTLYPRMGFERYLDLTAFAGAARAGAFVSDTAVADAVDALLRTATEPTFVFVVTMENHGPLHLERVTDLDVAQFYDQAPPAGCHDLTAYLRHLRNADRMLGGLRGTLSGLSRPAGLCWYGDHVPNMMGIYRQLGFPSGETPYLVWRSDRPGAGIAARPLAIHDLTGVTLEHMGLRSA